MKTFRVLLLVIIVCSIGSKESKAQTWTYKEITVNGDTVVHTFPPPDSTYLHDQIILKFHKGTLNQDSLCFDCSSLVGMGAMQKGDHVLDDSEEYCWTCLEAVRSQEFTLNIIEDPVLKSILLSYGGSYLTRMTTASPCYDTLSITRRGDTIPMDHYDWMILHFNNDTNVVPTLVDLFLTNSASLDMAGPNMLGHAGGITPCDPQYTDGNQDCLNNIGMPTAWTYSVGSSSIEVAVLDQGIDYNQCEMGAGIGSGYHIIGGWDEEVPSNGPTGIDGHTMSPAYVLTDHGTDVASVLAALTNNVGCGGATNWGMAGVAGGWGTNTCSGGGKSGTGVSLLGYRCGTGGITPAINIGVVEGDVEDAVLDAVGKSPNPPTLNHPQYGYGAQILNASVQQFDDDYTLRQNIAEAARQGAVFVTIKGNQGSSTTNYPSDYDPQMDIIAVGASDITNSSWETYSNTNDYVDFLAPGGDAPNPIVMLQSGMPENLISWYGTSFAAPHVSGVLGLMMSYYPSIPSSLKPFTEDWEGMLESSANAGSLSQNFQKASSGWGFLHADKMFTMLDPTIETYRLFHYTISGSDLTNANGSALSESDWSSITAHTTDPITLWDVGYSGSLTKGTYWWKQREIIGSVTYASTIDRTKQVYVWGTGGGSASATQYGWMPGNTIMQEPWAEVTDAEGGDGAYPNIKRAGIRHNFSEVVQAHTFQYEISSDGGSHWNEFPLTANLGINITVFGSSTAPAAVEQVRNEDGSLSIYPSIASTLTFIHSSSSERGTFEVFDALGRKVLEQNLTAGHSDFQIETANFSDGFYSCRLITPTDSQTAKFLVRH